MAALTAKDVVHAKRFADEQLKAARYARKRYLKVIRGAVRDGVSQAEIARQLGVTRQRVQQLLRS